MVINAQDRIRVNVAGAREFARRVRSALRLGRQDFNVCLVDDARIAEMNGRYRKKPRPTDVLSFPWQGPADKRTSARGVRRPIFAGVREFEGFLGDIVISVQTARRNARSARHSMAREIRWLILHGVLHLLGYDHETDGGEMTALELTLRERLRT